MLWLPRWLRESPEAEARRILSPDQGSDRRTFLTLFCLGTVGLALPSPRWIPRPLPVVTVDVVDQILKNLYTSAFEREFLTGSPFLVYSAPGNSAVEGAWLTPEEYRRQHPREPVALSRLGFAIERPPG